MNARILLATALIMFSGSGGLSDGFERAGFETTGLDFDPRACEDHRRLIGRPAHCVDIRAMGPADLRALHPECPDVLARARPRAPAGASGSGTPSRRRPPTRSRRR
jgi:site-specific DNA-cytosine methylase